MKKFVGGRIRLRSTSSPTRGQHPAERRKQSHGIARRQIPHCRLPLVHELLLALRCPKIRTQFIHRIIIKAEIGRLEPLLEDRHPREQAHGSAFNFARRRQQNLAVAFEKCAGHAAHHVLRESDRSVFQCDLDRCAVQRRSAHLIDARRIKAHLAELKVQFLRRLARRIVRTCAPRGPCTKRETNHRYLKGRGFEPRPRP